MRRAALLVIAASGCDALWRIDALEIPAAPDASPMDGGRDVGVHDDPIPFAHYTMDSLGARATVPDSLGGHEPLAAQVPALDASNVWIGCDVDAALDTATDPTIGALDDVQFFAYALDQTEIATLAAGD